MTVKKYITWVAPDSDQAYTHTEVWKSTDQGVTWAEFSSTEDPNYGADGIVIANSYAVDNVGSTSYWYKIRFYDNVALVYSDWSDVMTGSDFRGYCTIADVRNYTNVQSGEYSDAALQMMIDMVTKSVDTYTNRTWQGVGTRTDKYYDGDGSDYMALDDNDLIAVSSLAIDKDASGTYTAITSTLFYTYTDKAAISLDSTAESSIFPNRRRSVKITYTYGNADPTQDVRFLAVLMVANMMKVDGTRTRLITELQQGLLVGEYASTPTGIVKQGGY